MLEVRNLSAAYGELEILHNISFHVPKGKNLIIIGPNGCGKTTLLRTIAGILPYQGEILLNNERLKALSVKEKGKRIALMSQFGYADFDYSIEQTVMMGRYSHLKKGLFKQLSKEDKAIVDKSIEIAGLKGMEHLSVLKLSGGQLQRVFYARALAQCPTLILLDEPTNHLDLKYQAELLQYVKEWSSKSGHMAVGVLHDINQAIQFGDYVVVLKEGRVVEKGDVKDVITKELLKDVFEMDISSYMLEHLRRWEEINDGL